LIPRILVALIGAPLVLFIAYLGGRPFLYYLIALVVVLAGLEYGSLVQAGTGGRWMWPASALSLGMYLAVVEGAVVPAVALLLIIGAVLLIIEGRPEGFPPALMISFGALYIGLPMALLFSLREGAGGLGLFLTVLAITWGYDIGAYFAGLYLGRRPISPRLSPKKSWEGVAGGLCLSTVAGTAVGAAVGLGGGTAALLGLVGGVAGQLGDLFESGLKRWAQVKDSGKLLPGHGGILDRVDGLLLVSLVVYLAQWAGLLVSR